MRILFLSDNFPPEVNAPSTRTYEHCREWVKAGAEVTVITCVPNFPQGKVFEGYRNRLFQKEEIDGITVLRVWSYITANEGFLKRTIDYISFAVSSFFAGIIQSFDVIVATSPQFFTTWSGSLLSKIKRKPWVFELRDLWPETISAVGAIRQKRLLELLERIELWLYHDAEIVVAVTDSFKQNLRDRGISEDQVKIVTNGANMEQFQPQPKNPDLLKKLGLQNKFVYGYIGTHGMCHGLDFILHSLAEISDRALHFLFIGDGAMKEQLLDLASSLELEQVSFLNPVSKDEIVDYLSVIDVSLVPLKKSATFRTVIPSKIFEAAAMHKPILLGVEGQAQEIVEAYDAGLCYEPENQEDFLSKVELLKEDSSLYLTKAAGGARLAQAFDRRKLAADMLHILESITSMRS